MLAFLIPLLLTGTLAHAADYFVSPGGSNGNTGENAGVPFQTVAHAVTKMSPGDTLHFLAGTYREEVDLSSFSGTTAPVTTFKAHNGASVIWSGFASLDEVKANGADWVQHSANIYKIQLAQPIWQLFVGDAQMVPARWPNARWDDGS